MILPEPKKYDDLTVAHVMIAMSNLKASGDAAWVAFFVGLGWIEGANYCLDEEYLRLTAAPGFLTHNLTSIWWLWQRFGKERLRSNRAILCPTMTPENEDELLQREYERRDVQI